MSKKKQEKKQSENISVEKIIERGNKAEIRALFSFDSNDSEEEVLEQFILWSRYYFSKFFKHEDAPFHKSIDRFNYRVYYGKLKYFVNIVFRNGAKTTRTKLFLAFAIANDLEHKRKYLKILTKDGNNSKQVVTDIYNLLVSINEHYPEIFKKTEFKKEERMDSFTTFTSVKMKAGTVGTDQRGQIQEEARPDYIWFDDFETRETLKSAVKTKAIWDNMEEAKTGLSKDGGAVYTCNYLSERGNVHKLVGKGSNESTKVLNVPIKINNQPTWNLYTIGEINFIESDSDDFAGEYMCEPALGRNIYFDRTSIDRQKKKEPIKEIAGFKIFHEYKPSHRYGSGHDVGGGVGLDSSTSVFIDFHTIPNRVVATFKSNEIAPDEFGDEIESEANRFGQPIVAVENNKFDMCIGRLKQVYDNNKIYATKPKETKIDEPKRTTTYGWNTNSMTKSKMMADLKSAVADGHLELSDPALIAELRSYTRDDLMDRDDDVRLTTRHFDILIGCSIAFQMKDYAQVHKPLMEEAKIQAIRHERVVNTDAGL